MDILIFVFFVNSTIDVINQDLVKIHLAGAEGPWGPRVAVVPPTFCNFFLY